ncbi:hypothetical protein GH733_005803 [Mirounga leonina]|nr:hypothetical protein GH733_005803 [Mirounga leonina]
MAAKNEKGEHWLNYEPPAQKSIQEIQELGKDDESLRKNKDALLGRVAVSADPRVPSVVVTCLPLVCSLALGPLELDLTEYVQHTYREGIKIDKTSNLVGSYGPQAEEYKFLTLMEEVPKDMLARGSYKSCFTDDKTDHLSGSGILPSKKNGRKKSWCTSQEYSERE